MRHSQIRAFHHVALNGGFSNAAKVLGQSQPSLSEQVRKLEQFYDVLLFHRDRRQVTLTDLGAQLFILTRQYFEGEERIGDFLSRSASHVDGTLRIVADSAIHITRAIGRFRKANPKAIITVQTGNTEEVLEKLQNYEAEIGVVGNHQPSQEIEEINLGVTEVLAVTAKGYLGNDVSHLTVKDLTKWPLVFREQGSRTRKGLEKLSNDHALGLRPAIEVDGREAMREFVASGAGIGFVSHAELGTDTRLVPIPIIGANLKMTESIVYLSARKEVRIIRAFLKCAHSHDAKAG